MKLSIKELLKNMKEANDSIPSLYNNVAPYNLMRWDGTYLTADCWNWIKAYVWSNGTAFQNRTIGKYYYAPTRELGDWDGYTMLEHCTNRSNDMSKIQPGEYLYMTYNGERHAGVYYGYVDGRRKVFEYTPIWENGGFFTDIGPNGERSYQGQYVGNWSEHGMMTEWFDYDAFEQFEVGTKVIIEKGTKNYDTGKNFAAYVYSDPDKGIYYQLEVIQQIDARVVLGRQSEDWILGPVNADDVIKFTVPVAPEPEPEPIPEPEPEPTPEPDPIPDPDPEPDIPGALSFWDKVAATCLAIIDFFRKVLGDKE